jgi:hypothetical protein
MAMQLRLFYARLGEVDHIEQLEGFTLDMVQTLKICSISMFLPHHMNLPDAVELQ